jgi:AcrR family transcriptional regulator
MNEAAAISGSASPADAMRRKGRTQVERRAEAERRILEAAACIVVEKGLDGVTLAEAGEVAGYSKGLPVHYFRTKEDLLAALAGHVIRSFVTKLKVRQESQAGLPNLIKAVHFYLSAAQKTPTTARALQIVTAGALHRPRLAAAIAELNRSSAEDIEQNIRIGISRGEIRPDVDARAQGTLILAGLRGVVTQWFVDPERVDLDAVRDEFISSLRQGLAK